MVLAAFGLLGSAGVLVAAILHNVSTLLALGNSERRPFAVGLMPMQGLTKG
jgi:hypothetical protein